MQFPCKGHTQVFWAPRDISFPVDVPIRLPEELSRELVSNWAEAVANDPHLFDGPIFAGRLRGDAGRYIVDLRQSTYSHYLLGRTKELPAEFGCTSVAANALLRTKDNLWVVAQMCHTSSLRQRIKLIGGAVGPEDVVEGHVDPRRCMNREVLEEIGLVPSASELKYLVVRADSSLINACFEAELEMDSSDLMHHFERYISSLPEEKQEVGKLHFIQPTARGVATFLQTYGASVLGYVHELLHVAAGSMEPGDLAERLDCSPAGTRH